MAVFTPQIKENFVENGGIFVEIGVFEILKFCSGLLLEKYLVRLGAGAFCFALLLSELLVHSEVYSVRRGWAGALQLHCSALLGAPICLDSKLGGIGSSVLGQEVEDLSLSSAWDQPVDQQGLYCGLRGLDQVCLEQLKLACFSYFFQLLSAVPGPVQLLQRAEWSLYIIVEWPCTSPVGSGERLVPFDISKFVYSCRVIFLALGKPEALPKFFLFAVGSGPVWPCLSTRCTVQYCLYWWWNGTELQWSGSAPDSRLSESG